MVQVVDFTATKRINADLVPPRISEIVLCTSAYEQLRGWYETVLGVEPFYEFRPDVPIGLDPTAAPDVTRMCFIRLFESHPYTEVMTIFEVQSLSTSAEAHSGLHHLQLRNATVEQLLVRYERLKAIGITPMRTSNHGPGTSFYYRDPDGNAVELSANNFETSKEYLAFFSSEAYKRNPAGIDVDAETMLAQFHSGTPVFELVKL